MATSDTEVAVIHQLEILDGLPERPEPRDLLIRAVHPDIAAMFQALARQDGLRPRDLFARMLRDHLAARAAQESAHTA